MGLSSPSRAFATMMNALAIAITILVATLPVAVGGGVGVTGDVAAVAKNDVVLRSTQCSSQAATLNCSVVCALDCSGHGVCATSSPYADQVCVCDPGWAGRSCAVATGQIHSFTPCSDWCYHGSCQKDLCVCEPGFAGPQCDVQIDPASGCRPACARNGGLCRFGKCFCSPGAVGEDCDRREGEAASAFDQRVGVSSTTETPIATTVAPPMPTTTVDLREFTTSFAATAAVRNSSVTTFAATPGVADDEPLVQCGAGACSTVHGVCRWGRCHCHAGWTGSSCSDTAPACGGSGGGGGGGCSRHGVCLNGKCVCRPGFEGVACERLTLGSAMRFALFKGQRAFRDDEEAESVLGDNSALSLQAATREQLLRDAVSLPPQAAEDTWLLNSLFCSQAPPQRTIELFTGRASNAREAARSAQAATLCSGRGLCVFAQCLCEPGWEGAFCQRQMVSAVVGGDSGGESGSRPSGRRGVLCPRDCSGHGVCDTRDGTCACLPTHDGADCAERARCVDPTAVAAATSVAAAAVANKGILRPNVTAAAVALGVQPPDCSGHGICASRGRCVCQPGYSGKFCERQSACPLDCSGRGLCVDAPGPASAATIRRRHHHHQQQQQQRSQLRHLLSDNDASGGSAVTTTAATAATAATATTMLGRTCVCPPGFAGDACELLVLAATAGEDDVVAAVGGISASGGGSGAAASSSTVVVGIGDSSQQQQQQQQQQQLSLIHI